ncbi:MAG: signal transduction histidine kinase [Planctomycetota bacterium]|jgi:signal transduction histidine kinase
MSLSRADTDRESEDVAQALEQTKKFQRAILELECSPTTAKQPLVESAKMMTTLVTQEAGVERVSIWLFNGDCTVMDCLDLYEMSLDRHSSGQRSINSEYPNYFEALRTGRVINANVAAEDPRTREFTDGYLVPMNIASMLDAAVRVDGKVRGVVCLEHTGVARDWSPQEIAFAAEVADQFAFAMLSDERGRLRALCEQAQRIESLGLLVGGIAHDLNNLLMVILGNLELMESDHDSEELRGAKDATLRSSELVRKLLAFGQEQVLQREVLSLGEIAKGMLPFLQRIIPESIEVEVERSTSSDLVEADRLQLEQVIMNLCINARDSIEECTDHRVGKIHIQILDQTNDDQSVVFLVKDNGLGIPTELHDRVFEPFFTTKPREAGSGLGLAMIYGIVSQHDGVVDFESNEGQGATFRLAFSKSQS